jgi:hypothetical protein
MLRAWLAKLGLVAVLVWLLQHPLPGLLESFVFGGALLLRQPGCRDCSSCFG